MMLQMSDQLSHKEKFSLTLNYKFWRFLEKLRIKILLINKKSVFFFEGLICLFDGEEVLNHIREAERFYEKEIIERIKKRPLMENIRKRLNRFQTKNSII